jgi:hypothetical protein
MKTFPARLPIVLSIPASRVARGSGSELDFDRFPTTPG